MDFSTHMYPSDTDNTPIMSVSVYKQLDCSTIGLKYLSVFYYEKNMGKKFHTSENVSTEWKYAPPGSSLHTISKYVCDYFNGKSEWLKFGEIDGSSIYLGKTSVSDGYVYFWDMMDLNKPLPSGAKSVKTYNQGDCRKNRFKAILFNFHRHPMGIGEFKTDNLTNAEWTYPPPNSPHGEMFSMLCDYVKKNS